MKTCKICDTHINDNEVFCTNCGAKITEKAQSENIENSALTNSIETSENSEQTISENDTVFEGSFESAYENIMSEKKLSENSVDAQQSEKKLSENEIGGSSFAIASAASASDNAFSEAYENIGTGSESAQNIYTENMYTNVPKQNTQSAGSNPNNMYTPVQSMYTPVQSNNVYGSSQTYEQMQNMQTGEISFGNWVGSVLLSMMPVAGVIALLVWAFSGETNTGKKNWARATLLIYAIFAVITIVFYVGLVVLLINGIM